MKKYFFALLVTCFALVSFRTVHISTVEPLSFCAALDTVMKGTATQYEDLKGELTSTDDDGSQNHALKISFEGWPNNEYVKSGDDISIDIRSETTTKAKAAELFNATAKQIAECIGIEGETLKSPAIDKLMVFTKDKTDIGLMQGSVKGKSFVVITISKAE